MFTFIVCAIAYYYTLKLGKHIKERYMKVNNITSSEYDDIVHEKMKTYNPYEPNEMILG